MDQGVRMVLQDRERERYTEAQRETETETEREPGELWGRSLE